MFRNDLTNYCNSSKRVYKFFGTITDHHCRVEFQNRGSVHFHCFFWVADAPSLHKGSSTTDLKAYIDKVISTQIPDGSNNQLRYLVQSRQIHGHTDYCIKPSNGKCRFNYPRPACTETTILAECDQWKNPNRFYETK